MKASVVINVTDREVDDLSRVLNSVRDFASEIVIVDMTSGDALFEMARKYRAKCYKHELVPYVEIVRNFGISKAQNEWILIVDPDEIISSDLSLKLKEVMYKNEADYFRLPRKNIIFGKWIKHSRWWPDYNIRFFKKGSVYWNEVIHSIPLTKGKGIDLDAIENNAIIHYHYQTIEQYIERMNRYTTAQANGLIKNGQKFNWFDLIVKPSNEFLGRYFQGEGYKDSLHGLVLAGLQAFSEFVVYLKVWQKTRFKGNDLEVKNVISVMKKVESDFHYWQADTLLKQNGSFYQRLKRRFKLP